MAQRRFHYDAAFEYYLRANGIPYVAVDEARRALSAAGSTESAPAKLKSFDFVVYSETGNNLLIDVKGRKHSGKTGKSYQNWVTRDDVSCLAQWEQLFGSGFEAVFAFLFWCDTQPPDALFNELFEWNERWYAVLAIRLSDYQPHVKQRSKKWDTVAIPADVFQEKSLPLKEML